jgi:AraC-like DNA-binding protein
VAPAAKSVRITDLEKRLEAAKTQLEDAKKSLTPRHPDIARLEAEVQAASQRLAQAKEAEREPDYERKPKESIAQSKLGDRSIMNTSFTMDVGETVVVGTSRLSGNSKALIALLTAVAAKSTR